MRATIPTATPSSGPDATPATGRTARRRLARRPILLTIVLALLGTVLAGAVRPSSAGAAIHGVDHVDFDPNPYICEGALPTCLPDHGVGKSNTIYVHQGLVDGEHRYTDVTGTSTDPGSVWVQTTFSAQCGLRFRLNEAFMDHHGHSAINGQPDGSAPGDGSPPTWPQPVNHSNRTIPLRNVALHQPVADFLGDQWSMGVADVLQWGEDLVAERMGAGHSEDHARTLGHTKDRLAGLSATVVCRQVSGLYAWIDNTDWRRTHSAHEVQFVFLPVGGQPGDEDLPDWREAELEPAPTRPEPAADDLTEGFRVDQVQLFALPDADDACLLHLSGVVTTNGPGEIEYRFVDELGLKSQVFTTSVDHTQVAMLDHHVELEPIHLDTGLHAVGGTADDLVAEDDGEIGGYAQEQGDNVQGYYRIEITDPYTKQSNIASYNVDGCTTGGTGSTGPAPTRGG